MTLVNGTPAQHIPSDDRGLAYGDGVFRTLRCVNGEPLQWVRQYEKLAHDCARLALPCPDDALLLAEVRHARRVMRRLSSKSSSHAAAARVAMRRQPCQRRYAS
mgnify:CR=1 FL=1